MSPRLAFAIDAAYRAGRGTLAHFQTGTAVEIKSDATPVTVADKAAERQIREDIARSFPRDEILGEEEGGDATVADRWVIDPIDGTKSFVAGVPLYGTLLSYEVDRKPVLGVCYLPGLDELLWAETGSGAFMNGRPIRVSQRVVSRRVDRLHRVAPEPDRDRAVGRRDEDHRPRDGDADLGRRLRLLPRRLGTGRLHDGPGGQPVGPVGVPGDRPRGGRTVHVVRRRGCVRAGRQEDRVRGVERDSARRDPVGLCIAASPMWRWSAQTRLRTPHGAGERRRGHRRYN